MRKLTNLFSILVLFITVSACNSSGGGSGGKNGNSVRAQLIDAPVSGVQYIDITGESDITLHDGTFYCVEGEEVQFFVGGINLGKVTCIEGAKVYPQDLLPESGVTKNAFDSSSLTARAVLLLLSINPGDSQMGGKLYYPEWFLDSSKLVAAGLPSDYRGPANIGVTAPARALLQGYTNSVFTDDAKLKELVEDLRCWTQRNGIDEDDETANNSDDNMDGVITNGPIQPITTLAECRAKYHDEDPAFGWVIADHLEKVYDPAFNASAFNDALEGSVLHLEKSLYENSGIIANGYIP